MNTKIEKKSTISNEELVHIERHEIGMMLQLVRLDYPDVDLSDREHICDIIKEEYGKKCTPNDIFNWEEPNAQMLGEDARRIYEQNLE